MTTKHIKMINRTARQLPYILACAIAAFLGFSGLAQGQFEEFGKTFCHNPNAAAVGAALDPLRDDPRMEALHDAKGRTLFDLLDFKLVGNPDELCDLLGERIPPEELTAIFNLGVSLANIESINLVRRMEDIRAGSSGFSATGFTIHTGVREFSPGLAGPAGPEGGQA